MTFVMKKKSDVKPVSSKDRHPMLSDADINTILVNGAVIALSKLRRATHFDNQLYYYAEIGVYLEVSLSSGAGITDETREKLREIHMEATHIHMDKNKQSNAAK